LASTPEGALKKEVVEKLLKRGVYCNPVPGGTYGLPGSPDHILCYKGRFIAMEGKTHRGRQRQAQKDRQEEILEAGGRYVVMRCWEDIEKILDEIDSQESVCCQRGGTETPDR
jgi:hypothetical protein